MLSFKMNSVLNNDIIVRYKVQHGLRFHPVIRNSYKIK